MESDLKIVTSNLNAMVGLNEAVNTLLATAI